MADDKLRQSVEEEREQFYRQVERQKQRSRRAREEGDRTIRHGLRAFGVAGWSIVVPTLLGIAVGAWLDGRAGGGLRFTLSLMALGLLVGAANVWKWLHNGSSS